MKILQPLFGLRFDKSVIFSLVLVCVRVAMAANVVFDKYQLKWETLRSLHTLLLELLAQTLGSNGLWQTRAGLLGCLAGRPAL